MSDRVWIDWAPRWAEQPDGKGPTVQGRYEEPLKGEPQRVEAVCLVCGATYGPVACLSGSPRRHVTTFALVHQREHFSSTKAPV